MIDILTEKDYYLTAEFIIILNYIQRRGKFERSTVCVTILEVSLEIFSGESFYSIS